MSDNADTGDGEEYNPLSSFSVVNLSSVHNVIEEKNWKKSFQSALILKIKLFAQCYSMI